MNDNIFPEMPADWDGDIRSWENYCALVCCNNSLKAVAGHLRIVIIPDPKQIELAAELMDRAHAVISYFVKERETQMDNNNNIIFCKDCKHMSTYSISSPEQTGYWCGHKGGLWNDVTETDFCSRAERKSDE